MNATCMMTRCCGFLALAMAALTGFSAATLTTEWGEKVTPENALREYPRPQLERATSWTCLNGLWDWQVTGRDAAATNRWEQGILVPFAIETSLSRVQRLLEPNEVLWYRRSFEAETLKPNERLLLNFECVDWRTQVWINGVEVTDYPHEGGQLPFSFDITRFVKPGVNELKLSVWDPTTGFITSHGKQMLKPHGCLYTRSSGIVGTVWTEVVPATHLTGYRAVPDVAAGAVTVKFEGVGNIMGAKGEVKVLDRGKVVARAELRDWANGVRIELPRPVRLWSPDSPALYDLELSLEDVAAGTCDRVRGYFGMRSFELKKDPNGVLRFFLNGKATFVNGTLDQGWWPDGFLTPPSEEAMKFDIQLLKNFGYNAMRKHIKVEPRRYYALCDRLGIMVLQDLPSGFNEVQNRYAFSRYELKGMIDHLYNHPCVVMWIPYNEGWGQPDAAKTRDTLLWTMRYDPTRLVDGPSGCSDYEGGQLWPKGGRIRTEHLRFGAPAAGHAVDMHDYSASPSMYEPNPYRASFLGEYGGCSYKVPGHRWQEDGKEFSYGGSSDLKALESRYVGLMDKIATMAMKGLAGAIYTQTTDVENELNGLVTYDRKVVKFDAAALRAAHRKIYEAAAESLMKRHTVKAFPKEDANPNAWAYAMETPAGNWKDAGYDDSAWKRSAGGIGSENIRQAKRDAKVSTVWTTQKLYLRRHFTAPSQVPALAMAEIFHDEDAVIYLNGIEIKRLSGYTVDYSLTMLEIGKVRSAIRPGDNVLAVEVKDTCGGRYFDMSLSFDFLESSGRIADSSGMQ